MCPSPRSSIPLQTARPSARLACILGLLLALAGSGLAQVAAAEPDASSSACQRARGALTSDFAKLFTPGSKPSLEALRRAAKQYQDIQLICISELDNYYRNIYSLAFIYHEMMLLGDRTSAYDALNAYQGYLDQLDDLQLAGGATEEPAPASAATPSVKDPAARARARARERAQRFIAEHAALPGLATVEFQCGSPRDEKTPVVLEVRDRNRSQRWLLRPGRRLLLFLLVGPAAWSVPTGPERPLQLQPAPALRWTAHLSQPAARDLSMPQRGDLLVDVCAPPAPVASPAPAAESKPAPAPAPTASEAQKPAASPPLPTPPPRSQPRYWMVGTGAGLVVTGLVLSGLGIGALAVDGQCVDPACERRYAGGTMGTVGLGFGIPLIAVGATGLALGLTLYRVPAAPAPQPASKSE